MKTRKVYKLPLTKYFRMFPSDPKGSLDDFFSGNIKIKLKENPQKVYKPLKVNNSNILPGNLQRLPDDYFSEDTLIFIDAGFLSKLSKYFGNGQYLKFDKLRFAINLSKKEKFFCKKIFYIISLLEISLKFLSTIKVIDFEVLNSLEDLK